MNNVLQIALGVVAFVIAVAVYLWTELRATRRQLHTATMKAKAAELSSFLDQELARLNELSDDELAGELKKAMERSDTIPD